VGHHQCALHDPANEDELGGIVPNAEELHIAFEQEVPEQIDHQEIPKAAVPPINFNEPADLYVPNAIVFKQEVPPSAEQNNNQEMAKPALSSTVELGACGGASATEPFDAPEQFKFEAADYDYDAAVLASLRTVQVCCE